MVENICQKFQKYIAFPYFDYEHTWWRL